MSTRITQRNRRELEERGFTVINGVLTEEECSQYIAEYQDWIKDNFKENEFPHCNNSLINRYSIAHLSPSWNVRLKTLPVWEELWGTSRLLTSMDAVSIGRPPEEGVESYFKADAGWLHIDQGAGRLGLHAYQGGVYLETTNLDDWVFEAMEGSHKYHEDFFNEHPDARLASLQDGKDYIRLETAHVGWFRQRGCLRTRVSVAKGGLLLWDSRLVHCNTRPIKGRSNRGRWRWVVFVCMTPADWADEASLKLKRRAYRQLRVTSHWPSQGVRLFPENLPDSAPRPSRPLKQLPPVAKTLEAKQLAGVVPYKENKKSKGGNRDNQQGDQANSDKGVNENTVKGDNHEIPKPKWSPDYVPPKAEGSGVGWIVGVVSCVVVGVAAVLLYSFFYTN